jgi:hypothetical protein
MKKSILLVSLLGLIIGLTTSSSVFLYQTGIAGYTGAPGEQTCNSCHGGGSAANASISITSVPSFSNQQYHPDSVYAISITASAANFNSYGFACEILDSANFNAGSMIKAGTGVKFLNAFGRKNAVHTTPKNGSTASFTFTWQPPAQGKVTIHTIANAVNGNNNTTGDFVLQPVTLSLTSIPVTTETISTVGLTHNYYHAFKQCLVFPNPAHAGTQISFMLETGDRITVELYTSAKMLVREISNDVVQAGEYRKFVSLLGLAPGAYFLTVKGEKHATTQKLLIIN